jgi:hypothetical protein
VDVPTKSFSTFTVGEAFRGQARIEWLRLSGGHYGKYHVIRQMEVGYISQTGRWTTSHGLTENPGEKFTLGKGHMPSMLVIRHGGLVDSIDLRLADGRSTSAGGTDGVCSKWEPRPGAVVLGFAGRAGAALDQIRIVHGTLKPPTTSSRTEQPGKSRSRNGPCFIRPLG